MILPILHHVRQDRQDGEPSRSLDHGSVTSLTMAGELQ